MRHYIQKGLEKTQTVPVTLGANWAKGTTQLELTCDLPETNGGVVVNFAVVEKDLASSVKRGENSGRSLEHENVVRAFASVTVKDGKSIQQTLKVPEDVLAQNASLIAYVQDAATWEVVGATLVALPTVSQ